MVIEGALTLVDDFGETRLGVGDCAAFPAGDGNGHHVINKSDAIGRFLVVGTRTPSEVAYYADLDMQVVQTNGQNEFQHRNGEPYRHKEE